MPAGTRRGKYCQTMELAVKAHDVALHATRQELTNYYFLRYSSILIKVGQFKNKMTISKKIQNIIYDEKWSVTDFISRRACVSWITTWNDTNVAGRENMSLYLREYCKILLRRAQLRVLRPIRWSRGTRRVYFSHRRNWTLCMQIRLNVVAASEWKWALSLRAGEYIIMHSKRNSLKAVVIITCWARSMAKRSITHSCRVDPSLSLPLVK